MVNIHASCVLLGSAGKAFDAPEDAGVLLLGESGSGKSDLALRLIERGAQLVSDDRTYIFIEDNALFARAPASLAGLMEVRSVGIVALPFAQQARIALAVQMARSTERLPAFEKFRPPAELSLAEKACPPLIHLTADASAPAKVAVAVAAFAKALFRENRNPI